jgi:CRP-like cAMP-binding protein
MCSDTALLQAQIQRHSKTAGVTLDTGVVKKLIYFAQLDQDKLESIAAQSRTIYLERGDVLFSEGDQCEGLYFVISGTVKISRISPEGREQVLNVVGPFQSFGDVPVLDGGANPATVAALEASVIGLIPTELVLSIVRENGRVAQAMLRVFASRLRGMTTLVADLTHLDVTGRIAKVLIAYQTSSGHQAFRLGQQDLASMVGTTREVASRSLRTLEELGCIMRKGGEIEILSLERLDRAIEESSR